jgi:FAD-dependent oxidoreductase domain-containing protein 1
LSLFQVVDPTGTYFRREGLANHYLCGRSPSESEEPPIDNDDVDFDYFDEKIWPVLAHRAPCFENLKVTTLNINILLQNHGVMV